MRFSFMTVMALYVNGFQPQPMRSFFTPTSHQIHQLQAFRFPTKLSMVSQPLIKDTENLQEQNAEEDDEQDAIENLIIDFVSRISETPVGMIEEEDVLFAEPIFKELELLSKNNKGIDGDKNQVPEIMDLLLFRMTDEWQECIINDREIDFEPNIDLFNMVLDSWRRVIDEDNAAEVKERVLNIYNEIDELCDSGMESCYHTNETFDAIIDVIRFTRSKETGEETIQYYERMRDLEIVPTAKTYEHVIDIISKNREKTSASDAENLLREAMSLYPEMGTHIDVWNSILTAWAKSDLDISSDRIENILAMMDECNVKPNCQSFTIYLDSFAQRSHKESVEESERILNRLLDLHVNGQLEFEPDIVCWTTVIRGYTRLAKKRRVAAEKANKLLDKMITMYDEGQITVKADNIVYQSVFNAHCNAGFMYDAERILATMEYLWKQEGDESLRPTLRTYQLLIEGWMKSNVDDGVEKAESIFENVKTEFAEDDSELLPDVYRSLLLGYAKKENPDAALNMLKEMIQKGYTVDSFSFEKIIDSYASSGDFKKINAVVDLMEKCQQRELVQANERLYNTIIRAYIKEDRPGGICKLVQAIVKRMENQYENGNEAARPTIFTYNLLLKSCAKSNNDENEMKVAFNTAIAAFNEIRSNDSLDPDHVTYSSLIKCSTLLPEGEQKNKFIKATITQCAKNGFVNKHFVQDVAEYVSEGMARALAAKIQ